jgi:predicted SAM-dependent methyltransferase
MEESNISNSQENVLDAVKSFTDIFVHLSKPDVMPAGFSFLSASSLNDEKDDTYQTIYINDLLDYMSYNIGTSLLDSIANKLKSGGKLIIQAPDLYMLSSAITYHDVDESTAKSVLYSNKQTIYSMADIITELKFRKFNIVEMRYVNIFEYYLVATKI